MDNVNLGLKTVVGLFDHLDQARQAVQDLSTLGLARDDINLIAHAGAEDYSNYFDAQGQYLDEATNHEALDTRSRAATGATAGAILGALGGLLLGLSLLPVAGFGPIFVAGPVNATLLGALGGGIIGGLLGALTHLGVPEEHAGPYAEGVRRGGSLVIVKTTEARIPQVLEAMNHHHPVNVEERLSTWKQRGWAGYDPKSPAYTAEQIAAERAALATPGAVMGGSAVL
jgi:uncharacterized membrane protein